MNKHREKIFANQKNENIDCFVFLIGGRCKTNIRILKSFVIVQINISIIRICFIIFEYPVKSTF